MPDNCCRLNTDLDGNYWDAHTYIFVFAGRWLRELVVGQHGRMFAIESCWALLGLKYSIELIEMRTVQGLSRGKCKVSEGAIG